MSATSCWDQTSCQSPKIRIPVDVSNLYNASGQKKKKKNVTQRLNRIMFRWKCAARSGSFLWSFQLLADWLDVKKKKKSHSLNHCSCTDAPLLLKMQLTSHQRPFSSLAGNHFCICQSLCFQFFPFPFLISPSASTRVPARSCHVSCGSFQMHLKLEERP